MMSKVFFKIAVVFFSISATAATPEQLNIDGFAGCLTQEFQRIDFTSTIIENKLHPADLLLPYLAVYSGKRPPLIGPIAQSRWSEDYAHAEEALAKRIYQASSRSEAILPNLIYREALQSCSKEDAFCAALIAHNVLRTLGRSETAIRVNPITKEISDLNPQWFKKDRAQWLARAQEIQKNMISLHRDGSRDKWGDNYHFFGLLTFSIHERALYKNVSSAWLVARMNQVLNPVLAGGPEDPGKARIDRDSIEVASRYFDLSFQGGAWDCLTAAAYRHGL